MFGEQEKKMQEHIDRVSAAVDKAAETDGPHLTFEKVPEAKVVPIEWNQEDDASIEIEVMIGRQRIRVSREFPNDDDAVTTVLSELQELASRVAGYVEDGRL